MSKSKTALSIIKVFSRLLCDISSIPSRVIYINVGKRKCMSNCLIIKSFFLDNSCSLFRILQRMKFVFVTNSPMK